MSAPISVCDLNMTSNDVVNLNFNSIPVSRITKGLAVDIFLILKNHKCTLSETVPSAFEKLSQIDKINSKALLIKLYRSIADVSKKRGEAKTIEKKKLFIIPTTSDSERHVQKRKIDTSVEAEIGKSCALSDLLNTAKAENKKLDGQLLQTKIKLEERRKRIRILNKKSDNIKGKYDRLKRKASERLSDSKDAKKPKLEYVVQISKLKKDLSATKKENEILQKKNSVYERS